MKDDQDIVVQIFKAVATGVIIGYKIFLMVASVHFIKMLW